jgi:hypothetical protein
MWWVRGRRVAPLNRRSLNSAHIDGTDVPVEEPSKTSYPASEKRKKPPEKAASKFKSVDKLGSHQCFWNTPYSQSLRTRGSSLPMSRVRDGGGEGEFKGGVTC